VTRFPSAPFLVLAAVALGVGLAPPARAGDPPPAATSCTTHCHTEEATAFKRSVHARSLACTDCHGGDPTAQRDKDASHAAAKGFVGRIPREKIPLLCGTCHEDPVKMAPTGLPIDQLARYRTSNHGKALFEKGDTKVAVCSDCHHSHEVLPAADPRAPTAPANQPATCGRCHSDAAVVGGYGLSTDVVEKFKASVHGKALLHDRTRGAPSCADCHGAHGAAPPGVGAVAQVCGHCHANTEEQYRRSAHHHAGDDVSCKTCHEKEMVAGKGHEFRRGGCAACHDHHATAHPDETMFEGDAVGHCGHCHRQADPKVDAFREAVLGGTKRLKDTMEATRRRLQDAKHKGLFLEGETVYLHESERNLVSVLPLAHSLQTAEVERHLTDGVNKQLRTIESIDKKTTALRDRKIVMTGLVLLLLLFATILWVKLDAARRLT
jgi:hypothetical protein